MTRVAILWHMHQPYYEDLVTREHILPWVRLHALKDYYGMVALLEEFPQVKITFNLVPSLLVQLEAFAADRAHDRYLELGLKPPAALSREEVVFVLKNFFHAHRHRMIDIYPRYAELLALRGHGTSSQELEAAARRFTEDDLRDLQVWQKLAWIDPYYLDRDPRVRELIGRGRRFTEDDKRQLRAIELELLNAVIPAYRARAEAGQIEISASPFYHPILPLLCDTDIYKRTHPHSRMPRQRFIHPEDAQEQLTRAVACHERLFGRPPVGLWPSEGSVSDAMIPLAVHAGFQWMATDELVLSRTLATTFIRDGAGHVDQPHRLYRPYRVSAGGASIACGFRDHGLSDLIGFTYAGWGADAAADDFVSKLAEAGHRAEAQAQGQEPTVFIILDGENAWEHFEGGGRPFLRALYGRLAQHPSLRTVTMADACAKPVAALDGIFPGSWIDANYYIWIGHQDDQRAWSQLADARVAVDQPSPVDGATRARAREELFIAEGSDWFWWYGDDHSSEHDPEFDDLFRRHLRNVYRLLDFPIPDELFLSNISAGAAPSVETEPCGLITPRIDGEESSYFEWLGAGSAEFRDMAGAMHQVDRRPPLVTRLRFGFDHDRVYLCLDGQRRLQEALSEGHALAIAVMQPAPLRVLVTADGQGGVVARVQSRAHGSVEWLARTSEALAAAGRMLELAVPLKELAAERPSRLALFVTVHDRNGAEIERHPNAVPLELAVPDDWFEARNWSA